MLVTLYPPRVDGIVIAPVVDLGTAGEELEPAPMLATPFFTVYVHVMPSTISVYANNIYTTDTLAQAIRQRNFIIFAPP